MRGPNPDPRYFRALKARIEADHGREAAERVRPDDIITVQGRNIPIRIVADMIVRTGTVPAYE